MFAVNEFVCKVVWNFYFCFILLFSVAFGWLATVIPRAYTYYISTALFAIFGVKMLKEGYYMSPNEAQEEFEEVQLDLRKREDEVSMASL
jgi:putative Ca2+/H+ antiporter (TMEM165/GDT1 family)